MNNRSLINKLILFGGVFMLGLSVWAKEGMMIVRYEMSAKAVYNKQEAGDLITWSESESKEGIVREITELWLDGKLKKRKEKNLPHGGEDDSTAKYMKIDRKKGEVIILLDNVPTAMKARFSGDNFTINKDEYVDRLMKSMFGPSWNTSETAKYAMATQMKNKYPNLEKRARNLEAKIEVKSFKYECSLKG